MLEVPHDVRGFPQERSRGGDGGRALREIPHPLPEISLNIRGKPFQSSLSWLLCSSAPRTSLEDVLTGSRSADPRLVKPLCAAPETLVHVS